MKFYCKVHPRYRALRPPRCACQPCWWLWFAAQWFISSDATGYQIKGLIRVLDQDGIVHCVPTVGVNGCILRWKPRNVKNPCQF